jgi:hypothetical protein
MVRTTALSAAAMAALLVSSPAGAMPLAAKERLEQLAYWTPYAGACGMLGYTVHAGRGGNFASDVSAAILADAVALGADAAEAEAQYVAAVPRNVALFEYDMRKLSSPSAGAQSFRPLVMAFYGKLETECARLSADPVFAPFIHRPPANQLEAKRVAAEDAILEANGEASWQGPKSRARADLFLAAGTCRRFLDEERLAGYRTRMGAEGPRAQAFYEAQYSSGIDQAAEFGFDEAQCQRALAGLEAKAR